MKPHLALIDRVLTEAIRTGNRNIAVSMPPRHGKSELISKHLPAWYLGTHPDHSVILTSYESTFAGDWGGAARRLLEEHGNLFGVKVDPRSSAKDNWWILGRQGKMRTAGVGGPITGKGAHLLIIDDPHKNAEEAESATIREKIWEWYISTASTRIEPGGVVVVIQTRWNEDDLTGRLVKEMDAGGRPWEILRLPALAEEGDPLGRELNEPLWPERYSREFLEAQKRQSQYWFAALYQGSPAPREGGLFKRDWFEIIDSAPRTFDKLIRAWDKAGTDNDGDYTAGVLMGLKDNLIYLLDVTRGQWSMGSRERAIQDIAMSDQLNYGRFTIWMEREPGSSGKDSAEMSVNALNRLGHGARSQLATGSKSVRADDFAIAAEGGRVKLVKASWNRAYLDELCVFPNGAHDDQVDASSLAFSKLEKRKRFAAGVA